MSVSTDFQDSWLRCPYDGKRLVLFAAGSDPDELHRHECFNCDYVTYT